MRILYAIFLFHFFSFAVSAQFEALCTDENGEQGNGFVVDFAPFEGKLYVTGFFTELCGVSANHVAVWNGEQWEQVGSAGLPTPGHAIKVINNQIYCALYGSNTDSNYVYRLNSQLNEWEKVGKGFKNLGSSVPATLYDIAEFQGQPVVAGDFTKIGSQSGYNNIARWNGSDWEPLGSGLTEFYAGVPLIAPHGLSVFEGDIVVTGAFKKAGGVQCNGIARWNGTEWLPFGGGFNKPAYKATEYKNELYACGEFLTSGASSNISGIAKWDGTQWVNPGFSLSGEEVPYFFVHSLDIVNNQLYITGGFSQVNTDSTHTHEAFNICVFDGENIDTLGGGFPGNEVESVCEFDGKIFVGGGNLNDLYSSSMVVYQNIEIPSAVEPAPAISDAPALLFPNPAKDFIYIQKHSTYSEAPVIAAFLYDIQGKIVQNLTNTDLQQGIFTGDLPSGMYYLKVIQTQQVSVYHFSKM